MKLNYYLCSMKKSGIYKLTSPSGKCYIGQSTDMVQRILKYKRLQCKSQIKLYNAIQKYGFENFTIEVLYETDTQFKHLKSMLNLMEIKWIKKFNSIICGYNIRSGGSFGKHSEESKQKMSKSGKLKIFTEEHKLNLSKASQHRKETQGIIISPETQSKMTKSRQKIVIQYTLDGEFIKEWENIYLIENELNISKARLYSTCQGKQKSTAGFIWKYKNSIK